jgi:hypothetical protein
MSQVVDVGPDITFCNMSPGLKNSIRPRRQPYPSLRVSV